MDKRGIDVGTPAALLLLTVFAALVTMVLSMSADVYATSQRRDAGVLDAAVARQYLATKLWRLDGLSPAVLDRDGNEAGTGPGLTYVEDLDGTECRTTIYFHDGYVYEDFKLEGLGFALGDGESVLEAEDLAFTRTDRGIRVELVLPGGKTERFAVGYRSGGGTDAG